MDDGVLTFLGVPYAAAPTGPRRWRPPLRPEPWTGVRDATQPGPLSPQVAAGPQIPGDPTAQSEDCLHLSVWTPGLDDRRRPVLVWLHGGGFTAGTAGNLLYCGEDLARSGDVAVVAVNYRLGALGFLAHQALGAPGDGHWANWGLLDQLAALRWVRDHIGAFGGDPGNVALFGESAGGMAISALLAAPAARGLFRRAIIQSGPPYAHSAPRAAEAAEAVVRELGMARVVRERLLGIPAAELVRAVSAVQGNRARPGELPLPLLPVVDGNVLSDEPRRAVARGAAAGVELIVGTNRDEVTFFGLGDGGAQGLDESGLRRRILRMVPAVPPEEVVSAYRSARASRSEPVTPWDVWVSSASDIVFRWPSMQLAAAHAPHGPVRMYLFTWETPVLGGVLGACHALEIPFVLGTLRIPAVAAFSGGGPRAEALSVEMQGAWAAFARSGDPSTDRIGRWPRWDPDDRSTMVFGPVSRVERAPRNAELAVLERHDPLPVPGACG